MDLNAFVQGQVVRKLINLIQDYGKLLFYLFYFLVKVSLIICLFLFFKIDFF